MALVSMSLRSPAEADKPADDDKDRLYKETDHVKTYYRLARF